MFSAFSLFRLSGAQEKPKRLSRPLQDGPRGLQVSPKTAQESPKSQQALMFVRFLKDLRVLAFSASRRSKKGQEAPKTAPRWPKRPPSEPQDGLPPSPVLSPPRLEASLRAKSRTAATSMLSLHLRPAGAACTSREQRRRGTFFGNIAFKKKETQDGLIASEDGVRGAYDGSRAPEDGPKEAQEGGRKPKIQTFRPKRPTGGPKRPARGSKRPPNGPHRGPKRRPDRPEQGLKRLQNCFEETPRGFPIYPGTVHKSYLSTFAPIGMGVHILVEHTSLVGPRACQFLNSCSHDLWVLTYVQLCPCCPRLGLART